MGVVFFILFKSCSSVSWFPKRYCSFPIGSIYQRAECAVIHAHARRYSIMPLRKRRREASRSCDDTSKQLARPQPGQDAGLKRQMSRRSPAITPVPDAARRATASFLRRRPVPALSFQSTPQRRPQRPAAEPPRSRRTSRTTEHCRRHMASRKCICTAILHTEHNSHLHMTSARII
jgi:hypothetical protein